MAGRQTNHRKDGPEYALRAAAAPSPRLEVTYRAIRDREQAKWRRCQRRREAPAYAGQSLNAPLLVLLPILTARGASSIVRFGQIGAPNPARWLAARPRCRDPGMRPRVYGEEVLEHSVRWRGHFEIFAARPK